MALRADLVGRHFGRFDALYLGVGTLEVAVQWLIELLDHGHPRALALGHLVQLVFEHRGEVEIDDIAELLNQHVVDQCAEIGRLQPPTVAFDVAAVLDRAQGRGVGARATDAALLERFDQGCLAVTRRGLGEVLLGDEPHQVKQIPGGQLG